MRYISILIFTLLTFNVLLGQNCLDGEQDNLKLVFAFEAMQTDGIMLYDAYAYAKMMDVRVDTLVSVGFLNYVFLKLQIKSIPDNWNKIRPIFGQNCDGYLVATNKSNGLVYRIAGFTQRDLSAVFSQLNNTRLRKNRFLKTHAVEGVNLSCLFDAWKANSYDTDKYPCLSRCLETTRMR